MSKLKIQSLTVAYGCHVAVQEVSLDVASGEMLALIGPNGAGKSTLIRAISGVLPARAGQICVNGQNLDGLSESGRARLLAVVPQASPSAGAFTVEQVVLMGRTPYMDWLGRVLAQDVEAARRAMEVTAITHLAQRHIAELSGGEQQRVLLARALAQSTPILLLDEPTNHLDLQHQVSFLKLVRRLAHRAGLTVLMAMHDLNLVSLFADRVALLVEGVLRCVGKPRAVLQAQNISAAYQTAVQVLEHPLYKQPLIVVEDAAEE